MSWNSLCEGCGESKRDCECPYESTLEDRVYELRDEINHLQRKLDEKKEELIKLTKTLSKE